MKPTLLDDGGRKIEYDCDVWIGKVIFAEPSLDDIDDDGNNDLMMGESRLSKLEREMIAVVVSSVNRCYYCLTAHGQAVREMSGDPALGELLIMNYRAATLTTRQRAILDFAHKLTATPAEVSDVERRALKRAGCNDREIWDIASVAAFFNLSNRMATAVDMMPNLEYHAKSR